MSNRWVPPAALGATALAVAAWLAACTGHPLPGQRVAVTALVLLWTAWAWHAARHGMARLRAASESWWPEAMLLVATLVLFFSGLGHEITGRDFGDEGTFLSRARAINEGRLLRSWFVYPHLLFYLDAFGLWVAGLFPDLHRFLAAAWGVHGPHASAALVTRWVTAAFGAATLLPAYRIASWVGGRTAARLAAASLLVSSLFVTVAHLSIADVPAAFFATWTLARVTHLVDRERSRDYLIAGLGAGLAAGSKYPAGLVAVAIVAVWLGWRWRERRWRGGLVWAGTAALATFVATTPSVLAYPAQLFAADGPSLLFGARLYAEAGWAGVIKGSNLRFYGSLIERSLGWGLLVVGGAGLLVAGPTARRRLAWLLPFPTLFFILIVAMKISVARNLQPLLPWLAVAVGTGVAALWSWAGTRSPGRRGTLAAAGIAAILFLEPAGRVASEAVRRTQPTTRDLASRWIHEQLPPGAFLVQEDYTPPIRPPLRSRSPRFVIKLSPAELSDPRHDFVLVASQSYQRFLDPKNLREGSFGRDKAERYREILALPLVREFRPGRWRAGPRLSLHRLDPDPIPWLEPAELPVARALTSEDGMRTGDGVLRWTADDQWALFKPYLRPGRYQAVATPPLPESARVRITDRLGRELGAASLGPEGAQWSVGEGEKLFLYLYLPAGSTLRSLRIERLPPPTP